MAKYQIEWSIDARLDLIDILEFYINRNQDAVYSKKLYSKINKSIKSLEKNPFLGTKTDYESVRALVTDNYHVIYEVFNELILIIMIWDCRRNPKDKIIFERIK